MRWVALIVLSVALSLPGCGGMPSAKDYNQQGLEHYTMQNYSKAAGAFEEAVELKPRNANYHYNLAAAYQACGDLERALFQYQKAVQLDPGLVKSYDNMAKCYLALGNEPLAIETYQAACNTARLSAVPFYSYGNFFRERGDLSRAEEYYRKGVAADPDDAMAHYLLSDLLMKQGRREEGLQHYSLYLERMARDPRAPQVVPEKSMLDPNVTPQKPEIDNLGGKR